MKLQTKDLVIGDWVKVKSAQKQVKVKEIKQSCIYTEDNGYEYNEIGPIPLTPELLEKNGFRYNDTPFVQAWEQYGLSIYGSYGKYLINCGQDVDMDVSYVHQLQRALRLCGIDKQIVL